MDHLAALRRITISLRNQYSAKKISAVEISTKMKRIGSLRKLAAKITGQQERRATIARKVSKARALFSGTVVAIDCEFTDDLLYEVGITTQLNNQTTTATYIVAGHEQRLERKAIFGKTYILPVEEIRAIAQAAYNSASLGSVSRFQERC